MTVITPYRNGDGSSCGALWKECVKKRRILRYYFCTQKWVQQHSQKRTVVQAYAINAFMSLPAFCSGLLKQSPPAYLFKECQYLVPLHSEGICPNVWSSRYLWIQGRHQCRGWYKLWFPFANSEILLGGFLS